MHTRKQRASMLALLDEICGDIREAIGLLAGYVDSKDAPEVAWPAAPNDAMRAVQLLENALRKVV